MNRLKEMVVCRCEEVTFGLLQETAEKHQCTARELKLRTRAGMGFCGGRTCRVSVDKMIASIVKEVSLSDIPLKYQPPIRPVTFRSVGDNHE
ncbi:MAG TPA: pyridine nucleotide-disulfide oxidoreductase [Bacillus bacterium]|uniref:Pyridine nucleotide-disulfide oxidoreductase n=1 Tax=Siminovitchia fordii TaxID=254759 RepID=A0ABQ4K7V6_9BACI|nr:pyridine nucleotide-disulfide oxidoreductase [Siminovitchia fordii]HBZ11691.1 pyridine nucleotide-disulfide oxidoreductase [Bacillus sp. (in: firmicutes)]